MAEEMNAFDDEAPSEARTALEAVAGVDARAAVGAVADIRLPMLRVVLTFPTTNTPLRSLLLRRSTTVTWF
jgi:hypothetical protein